MSTSPIITSFRRICSKCSSLLLLFQRAPLIQALMPEASVLGSSAVMNAVPATIAVVAGLGAFDTVAGATLVSQVSPSAGSATVPASSGVQLNGVFQIVGAGGHTPQSWNISSGTLPTGLTLANKSGKTTTLTGTTTQTGNFAVIIKAWENANLTGRSTTGSFTIAVTQAPAAAIATHPVSTTINSGSTVTLNVVASGTAPFTYQWYQGPLTSTTTPVGTNSASFTSPALFANTSYWVKVTNAANTAGAISTLATITVNQPAAITSSPSSATINAGETTQLSVAASGTAPLTYQWYQGASPSTTTPIGTNSATFTTPALIANTNYWVKVTNAANVAGANSTTALVTVRPLLTTWKNSIFNPTQLASPTISSDAADPDGDGVSNINEYLFGSSPLVSQPSILATSNPTAGQFQLSFTARAATGAGYHGKTRRYAIEATTDPSATWTLLTGFENIIATGQQINAVVPATTTKRFFRVKTWLTP